MFRVGQVETLYAETALGRVDHECRTVLPRAGRAAKDPSCRMGAMSFQDQDAAVPPAQQGCPAAPVDGNLGWFEIIGNRTGGMTHGCFVEEDRAEAKAQAAHEQNKCGHRGKGGEQLPDLGHRYDQPALSPACPARASIAWRTGATE